MAVPALTVPVIWPPCVPSAAVSRNTSTTVPPGGRPAGDVQVTVLVPPGQATDPAGVGAIGAVGGDVGDVGDGGCPSRWLSSACVPNRPPLPGRPVLLDCATPPDPSALTPGGRCSRAVTGSDGASPVFRTVIGRSTGPPPGVNVIGCAGP